jgi:predicted dehydrogenase
VRIAVVGVGSLGQHHARILAAMEGVSLAAVVDRDAERAGAIAARHGVAALTDFRDLPADLDAVTVAVPTVAHAAVVEACLERRLAVLVEKPIAATLDEGRAMAERAARAGRPLVVGHTERFNPALRAVAPRIRGARFIEAHRLGVFAGRSTDIDVVLDLMIHDLDVILSLVRSPLVSVDAVGVHALTDKVDIANARLRFADGCVANVTASRISTEKTRKLRIFESDAYISIDYARQEVVAYGVTRRPDAPATITREALGVENAEPLERELRAFVDLVRGRPAPAVTAEEGCRALELALRIGAAIAVPAGGGGP